MTKKILTVDELTAALRNEVETAFSDIWVEGEVSSLKIPSSGHCYFILKDKTAQIKAVLFRSFSRARYLPKEGESVLIRGHLTIYEARGEYQIIVDSIEPNGIGALMAAYEALKERLMREGLFDERHKKPIPAFPRKIALITSSTGAVLQDFLRIISERETPVSLLIVPVLVQGEQAASDIIRAFSDLNQTNIKNKIDLIVLMRGGGSLLDLWTFNEEAVARAIFKSEIPVMTAIGHETDTTLADWVSDFRAATPSVAAEKIAHDIEKQIERFERICDRLEMALPEKIREASRRLQTIGRLLGSYNPVVQIAHAKQRARFLNNRLDAVRSKIVSMRQGVLEGVINRLDLLSPLRILGRGYSIVQKVGSLVMIRDSAEVAISEMIVVKLHHGALTCEVAARLTPKTTAPQS
ncbi:MAG: exodeoxyribonuclease VII large subunit [Nitrospirota bacterium]